MKMSVFGLLLAVLPACDRGVLGEDFRGNVHAKIEGIVLDSQQRPVVLARVEAKLLRPVPDADGNGMTYTGLVDDTDSSGRYLLEVERLEPFAGANPDTVTIQVMASDPRNREGTYAPDSAAATVRFVLVRDAPVSHVLNYTLRLR